MCSAASRCVDCEFFLCPPVAHYKDAHTRLLDPDHFLFPLLGARFPLESAIGMNGRVWVNAREPRHIIAISRCIEAVDPDGGGMDEASLKKFLVTLDV